MVVCPQSFGYIVSLDFNKSRNHLKKMTKRRKWPICSSQIVTSRLQRGTQNLESLVRGLRRAERPIFLERLIMSRTLITNLNIKVPLPQLWKAFKDLGDLLPRLMPNVIESTRYVEGFKGVGSIREYKFGKGMPIIFSKEIIEAIDEDKHIYTYRLLEGDLMKRFSLYRTTWEFKPQVGGLETDVTWTIEYIPIEKDATLDKLEQVGLGVMKELEAHLLAIGHVT